MLRALACTLAVAAVAAEAGPTYRTEPCLRTLAAGLIRFLTPVEVQVEGDRIVQRALKVLEGRIKDGAALTSPTAVRLYLTMLLAERDHEVFVCIWLDAQHRVIASQELFRCTLTQTTVHPRVVVKSALRHNAAAVIFGHNHPNGVAQPSQADQLLTCTLKDSLDRQTPSTRHRMDPIQANNPSPKSK